MCHALVTTILFLEVSPTVFSRTRVSLKHTIIVWVKGSVRNWGDGSVYKALGTQMWRPESGAPCKNPGAVPAVPEWRRWRLEGSWGSWSCQMSEFWVQWETLSQSIKVKDNLGKTININLWLPHEHTPTSAHTPTRTHTPSSAHTTTCTYITHSYPTKQN